MSLEKTLIKLLVVKNQDKPLKEILDEGDFNEIRAALQIEDSFQRATMFVPSHVLGAIFHADGSLYAEIINSQMEAIRGGWLLHTTWLHACKIRTEVEDLIEVNLTINKV
ncbi:hypothetical protein CPT_Mendera_260 [Stenotrophomonas phage Mendera]|uniref:Uncharacterized protein n=1 Tax=Stenotrophomonas phage Mendera TaxID=2650877 RepID=A0A5P8PJ78_9CAUD|nr:hypothetical protein HWC60_gp155 [Stenotrophomonas phage Mendera]QFR56786.1 hypothetical protein CPT_Mendera_260 [Stenotrophomonas phage Mendera]